MKTWNMVILGLLIFSATCGLGCKVTMGERIRGCGDVVSETYRVKGFSAVSLSTCGDLHIEVGDRESLRVVAQENLHRHFDIEVSGETLKIKTRRRVSLSPTKRVEFLLTVKELDTIFLSGSGNVFAPDLEADQFLVGVSGSGDVDIGHL